MIRIYKSTSLTKMLLILALIGILITLSLPFFAGVILLIAIGNGLKKLIGHTNTTKLNDEDKNFTVVNNKKIGPYKISENPNEPGVIEIQKL